MCYLNDHGAAILKKFRISLLNLPAKTKTTLAYTTDARGPSLNKRSGNRGRSKGCKKFDKGPQCVTGSHLFEIYESWKHDITQLRA